MQQPAPVLTRWRTRQRPLAAVALMAVLMLLTAPLRMALGGCDLCPPDCPMHAAHHGAAHADQHGAPRMHCHNAPASPADSHSAPRLTRPPCGTHAALAGLDLTPMLPAAPLHWTVVPRVAAAPSLAASARLRAADPPDTPPPDATA